MEFRGDIQLVQKRLRLALRFPAAELGKLCFQLGSTNAVLFGKIGMRIERVLLVHDLDEALMSQHDRTQHRLIVILVLVLCEHGHTLILAEDDLPLIGFDLPRKHLQKGGLPRAVRADDAVTVACREF